MRPPPPAAAISSVVTLSGILWCMWGLVRPLPASVEPAPYPELPLIPLPVAVSSEAQLLLAMDFNPFHPTRSEVLMLDSGPPQDLHGEAGDVGVAPPPVLLGTAVGFDGAHAVLQWAAEAPLAMKQNDERNGYRVQTIRKGAVILAIGETTITIRLRGEQ